jgi:hypothetical protein
MDTIDYGTSILLDIALLISYFIAFENNTDTGI